MRGWPRSRQWEEELDENTQRLFKVKVALAALAGDKTLAELA